MSANKKKSPTKLTNLGFTQRKLTDFQKQQRGLLKQTVTPKSASKPQQPQQHQLASNESDDWYVTPEPVSEKRHRQEVEEQTDEYLDLNVSIELEKEEQEAFGHVHDDDDDVVNEFYYEEDPDEFQDLPLPPAKRTKLSPQSKTAPVTVSRVSRKSERVSPSADALASLSEEARELVQDRERLVHVLKQFDLETKFGPCMGLTRLERFQRAQKFELDPPLIVGEILMWVEDYTVKDAKGAVKKGETD
ncbi:hypothetical protein HK102_001261, partial [Quaeritorhiza haematococci]